MEINESQHPDSVWTWKSSAKSKVSLWLPYFDGIEKTKSRIQDHYRFLYKGGEIYISLKHIDFIMLYGASGILPIDFLDKLASYRIPLMIHRRNMPSPYLFFPDAGNDSKDILSAQICARENQIKTTYIAKTLTAARFHSMEYLITIPSSYFYKLRQCRSVTDVRTIESEITRRYWRAYFRSIGLNDEMIRRDRGHPVNKALNAASFFISGILLRWILFHKLSPEHGYLHEQTTYPSLVFDLIEPYRYIFEKALLSAAPKGGLMESSTMTGAVINQIKKEFEEAVYVPATRQLVRRKNLLHGIVLGLRAYLNKEMKRFVIPIEGARESGRPMKISFKMPGGIKN